MRIKNHFLGEYTIKVATSIEDVEELRSIWYERQWYPDTDIDLYLTLCNSRKEIIRPHVILLSKNGHQDSMMIGRMEDTKLDINIGYKVLFKIKVRSLTIMYGGILGNTSPSVCAILIQELLNCLARGEAEIVFINHLRLGSPIHNLAITTPSYFCRDHLPVPQVHWKTVLPRSYDEFYRTRPKNFRNNLRKYSNRLMEKYGENLSVICFQNEIDTDRLIRDVETIASKTYLRGMGFGFIDDVATRSRIKLAMERCWFRGYMLYLDHKPCAFLIGVKYGKIFFPWATGYDPMYNQYSPGTILFMNMVKALFDEGNIEAVDFGFGDAFYKHNLCDEKWQEASVYIFAPTPKSITLNIIRTLNILIYKSGVWLLKRGNSLGKIKRLWRDRLAQKTKNDNGDSK